MSDDRNRIIYCGNIHDKVTEELLYELFLQSGPLENVAIPQDSNGRKKGYAFITFKHECSVPYAIQLLNNTLLFGRSIRLQHRTGSSSVGASPSTSSEQLADSSFVAPNKYTPEQHRSNSMPHSPFFNTNSPRPYYAPGVPGHSPQAAYLQSPISWSNQSAAPSPSFVHDMNVVQYPHLAKLEQQHQSPGYAAPARNQLDSHRNSQQRNQLDSYKEPQQQRNYAQDTQRRKHYDTQQDPHNSRHEQYYQDNYEDSDSYKSQKYYDHYQGQQYHGYQEPRSQSRYR